MTPMAGAVGSPAALAVDSDFWQLVNRAVARRMGSRGFIRVGRRAGVSEDAVEGDEAGKSQDTTVRDWEGEFRYGREVAGGVDAVAAGADTGAADCAGVGDDGAGEEYVCGEFAAGGAGDIGGGD